MFRYRVVFTLNGRRYMSDCARSFHIANTVAQRRLTDGATDVVIEVTKTEDAPEEDPSWPPIEVEA